MRPIVLISEDYNQLDVDLDEVMGKISSSKEIKPTIAIIFLSIKFDFNRIKKIFSSYKIDIFGATSSGEIATDLTYEINYQEKIVTMLLPLPPDSYRIKYIENKREQTLEFGNDIGEIVKNTFEQQSIIIMASGFGVKGSDIHGDKLIEGITSTIGKFDIPLFGGFAGDNFRMKETIVFTKEFESTKGAVLLIFDNDKIEIKGLSVCGWEGIGNIRTITKAEGNKVYEIDHIPIVDFYKKTFPNFKNTKEEDYMNTLGYHLLILKGEEKIARHMLRICEDEKGKSVFYGGEIQEGAKVQFYHPSRYDAVKEIEKQIKKFNDEHNLVEFDGILLFSCCIRLMTMEAQINDEINILKRYSPIPLAGFFTYGEIGNLPNGVSCHYNNTISIVFMKQKDRGIKEIGWGSQTIIDSQSLVDETIKNLKKEKNYSNKILFNIIPKAIGERPEIKDQIDKNKEQIIAGTYVPKFIKKYQTVSIMIYSITFFKKIHDKTQPEGLVAYLNETFKSFDQLAEKNSFERLKTMADISMVVSGLGEQDDNVKQLANMANMALDMLKTSSAIYGLKIGIHTGPVIGGIIGASKFSFDIWGKTVDTAYKMVRFNGSNKIRVTQAVHEKLKDEFELEPFNSKEKDKTFFLLKKKS